MPFINNLLLNDFLQFISAFLDKNNTKSAIIKE